MNNFSSIIKLEANCPSLKGSLASKRLTFGECGRYAVAAVHTRFEAVEWMVWDAETPDEVTGLPASIVRQADSLEAALAKFDPSTLGSDLQLLLMESARRSA